MPTILEFAVALVVILVGAASSQTRSRSSAAGWGCDGKDTLALGSMTGVMMFQCTIPVPFGVLFTPWSLQPLDLFAVALALVSGGLIYLALGRSGKLRAGHLLAGGTFYLLVVAGAVVALV